jgi:hypothetical protein
MKRLKRQISNVFSPDPEKSVTSIKKNHSLAQIGRSDTIGGQEPNPFHQIDNRRRSISAAGLIPVPVSSLETPRPRFLPLHQQYYASKAIAKSSTALDQVHQREKKQGQGSLQHLASESQSQSRLRKPDIQRLLAARAANNNVLETRKLILKAKAEGSTVSLVGGSLYIDYRYVCEMPYGCMP